MESREYRDGERILEQGEASDRVFRITSGEVEVYLEDGGRTVRLGSVGAGEMLGEMGVVENLPRSASAVARGPVVADELDRDEFFRSVSEDRDAALRLIERLSHRLRVANMRLAAVLGRGEQPAAFGTSEAPGATAPGVTVLPASEAMEQHVPADGLVLADLPWSVGRLPLDGEPAPFVPIDLRLPDAVPFRLSRQHFALLRDETGCAVLDLGSTLGTVVNGTPLGHHFEKDIEILSDGDNLVSAGGEDSPFRFRVRLD